MASTIITLPTGQPVTLGFTTLVNQANEPIYTLPFRTLFNSQNAPIATLPVSILNDAQGKPSEILPVSAVSIVSGVYTLSQVTDLLDTAGNPTVTELAPQTTTSANNPSSTTPTSVNNPSLLTPTSGLITSPSLSNSSTSSLYSPSRTTLSISSAHSPVPSATTSTSGSSAPTSIVPPPPRRLANGAVAGIVIAVALGLAFATFLATFLVMRRKRTAGEKGDHHQESKGHGVTRSRNATQQNPSSDLKEPISMETFTSPGKLENYIPQSADDKAVQNNVKTTLDQIEMHVENFYQSTPQSGSRPRDAELDAFNSPTLPNPLATLLPQSRNAVLLIKHALAQFVISSISLSGNPESTLLPVEFVLIPSTVKAAKTGGSVKPGSSQVMSRWRVLTAYLRPTTSQDPVYIAQRDRQINEMGQAFSRAFAPWKNPKYKDEERIRSLFAILKSAADLGIFIFSQPFDLQFHWSKKGEVGANSIVLAPALVKTTDERGQTLTEPQVMLQPVIQRT